MELATKNNYRDWDSTFVYNDDEDLPKLTPAKEVIILLIDL